MCVYITTENAKQHKTARQTNILRAPYILTLTKHLTGILTSDDEFVSAVILLIDCCRRTNGVLALLSKGRREADFSQLSDASFQLIFLKQHNAFIDKNV